MKMKLSKIIGYYETLTGRGSGRTINPNAIINKTFPAKLSYGISRNIKKMEEEIDSYNEERKKICERLAEKDEDGKPVMQDAENGDKEYKLTDKNRKILVKELNDLLDSEVEIEIHMVSEGVLDQCVSCDRYNLPTTKDLVTLDFMIEPGK